MVSSEFLPQLQTLSDKLSELLKGFRQPQINSEDLKSTLALSEHLLKLFKQYPDPVTGYAFLYKQKLPYSTNLILNTSILTTLLCQRLQWNDTSTKQLICAALTVFSHQQRTIEHFYLNKISLEQAKEGLSKKPSQLIGLLGADARQSWKSALYIANRLHLQSGERQLQQLNKLNQCQQIVFVAAKLALAITPNKLLKAHSWAHALKSVCQGIPTHCYQLVEPLLQYPGLYPPGTKVQTKKGKTFVIQSIQGTQLMGQAVGQTPVVADCESLDPQHIKGSYPMGRINSASELEQWWHPHWSQHLLLTDNLVKPSKNTFRVDSPPDSLLAIQLLIQTPEPDTNKLTALIGAEPIFADHIQHLASLHSRQHLPVKEVKHAIMMHGFDRTNSILIQQAMLLRLAQHQFPLQQTLIQYTQLAGQIAANLAQENKMLVPEQAMNYITFATSGLFTHVLLKTCLTMPAAAAKGYSLDGLFRINKAELIKQHSVMLTKAWQQERIYVNGIQLHDDWQHNLSKPTQRLAALLGVSLLLARQMYFGVSNNTDEQSYLTRSLQCLGLSEEHSTAATAQAMANTHCFSPLS